MTEERTPLLLRPPSPSQSPILTVIHSTYVHSTPLPKAPLRLPDNSIGLITATKAPHEDLLKQLTLPPLPTPSHPRLTISQSAQTVALPNLRVSANSTIILAVSNLPIPTIPPASTLNTILSLLVLTTIPQFQRAVEAVDYALDSLESTAFSNSTEPIQKIWSIRREVSRLRRHGHTLRHILRTLHTSESSLRSLHLSLETLSLLRDSAYGALELLLAVQNNRMQETMQTLAVVTTMFVPLTFLAGIEGMNFVNQPELNWGWSYGAFWMVVGILIIGQIIYFRKKGWI